MANTIALAKVYEAVVDQVFKDSLLSGDLEGRSRVAVNAKANEVEILKVQVPGLATHVRGAEVMEGDVTTSWETIKLTQERSRKLIIEDTDDEEALGIAFGAAVGEFTRTEVVPELDAYRFASVYGKSKTDHRLNGNIESTADFKAAYSQAELALNDAEVPEDDRILYVSYEMKDRIAGLVNTVTYNGGRVETRMRSIDGVKIIYIPSKRFYTGFKTKAVTSSSDVGGFENDGTKINFMLVSRKAVEAYVKKMRTKIFDPSTDDSGFRYRFVAGVYHDVIGYDNKLDGIFVSAKSA